MRTDILLGAYAVRIYESEFRAANEASEVFKRAVTSDVAARSFPKRWNHVSSLNGRGF